MSGMPFPIIVGCIAAKGDPRQFHCYEFTPLYSGVNTLTFASRHKHSLQDTNILSFSVARARALTHADSHTHAVSHALMFVCWGSFCVCIWACVCMCVCVRAGCPARIDDAPGSKFGGILIEPFGANSKPPRELLPPPGPPATMELEVAWRVPLVQAAGVRCAPDTEEA